MGGAGGQGVEGLKWCKHSTYLSNSQTVFKILKVKVIDSE